MLFVPPALVIPAAKRLPPPPFSFNFSTVLTIFSKSKLVVDSMELRSDAPSPFQRFRKEGASK